MSALIIQKECFSLLCNLYYEYNGPYFMLRKRNNAHRIELGYYFLGNDRYVHISFWEGRDWKEKINYIGFVIMDNGESFIEISGRDNSTTGDYLKGLVVYLDKYSENKFEEIKTNKWLRKCTSLNYLLNLLNFIEYEKGLIDNYLYNHPVDFINFIRENEFLENLKKFKILENNKSETQLKEENDILVEKNLKYRMSKFHNLLQNKLFLHLESLNIYETIELEKNFVDVTGIYSDGSKVFYEVKPGKIKNSIRQSIGQLLEYNHYPNYNKASKLIIVSEQEPEEKEVEYLVYLRQKYRLPIYLQIFYLDSCKLSELY